MNTGGNSALFHEHLPRERIRTAKLVLCIFGGFVAEERQDKIMKKNKRKAVAICAISGLLIILFAILIVKGSSSSAERYDSIRGKETARPTADTETQDKDSETSESSEAGIEYKFSTGDTEIRITPGGVEYSFIDTSDMTEEEIAALEERLDEEALQSYDPNVSYYAEQGLIQNQGKYINQEVSCTFPSGSVLSIGIDVENTEALYLNPVYKYNSDEIVMSDDQTAFAFYFRTEYGSQDISSSSTEAAAYNSGSNTGKKYFYITDRTYDTLVPAEYLSASDYGICWRDMDNFHGFDGRSADILIRVIRLPDGQLMGTAKMEVTFDEVNETYQITNLYYDDVSATGELNDEERSDVLDKAFVFFCSDDKNQSTDVDAAYWNTYRSKAVVEKTDKFYFPKLFDCTGNVINAGQYSGMDIYAVNLNYPNFGFVTIYVAPQKQIYGLRSSVSPNDDLQAFAFDAFKPFTVSTLFVPTYQQEEFFQH